MPEANTLLFYDEDGRKCFFRKWDGSENGGLRGGYFSLEELENELIKLNKRIYFSTPCIVEAGVPNLSDLKLNIKRLQPMPEIEVESVTKFLEHHLN